MHGCSQIVMYVLASGHFVYFFKLFPQKLVNETFQKLWFTPTPNHDKETMTRKIINITDVVSWTLIYDSSEHFGKFVFWTEKTSKYLSTQIPGGIRSTGFVFLASILVISVILSTLLVSHVDTVVVFARKCSLGTFCAAFVYMACYTLKNANVTNYKIEYYYLAGSTFFVLDWS